MTNLFQRLILKWQELGFFQFLFPFMLSSAIFYGLLRKSRIFAAMRGEEETPTEVVNAVVALVASFMIWAYPILIGIDIGEALSAFFMQGMVVMLFVSVGIMIAGMFHPNIQDIFKENYKWAALVMVFLFVIVGIGLVLTSGLWEVFGLGDVFGGGGVGSDLSDTIVSLVGLGLVFGVVMLIVKSGGKGGKEGKSQ